MSWFMNFRATGQSAAPLRWPGRFLSQLVLSGLEQTPRDQLPFKEEERVTWGDLGMEGGPRRALAA